MLIVDYNYVLSILAGPKCGSTRVTLQANITLRNFCTKSHQYAVNGDFNGDGHVDILCHDTQTGKKWIYYGSNTGYSGIGWENEMSWCNHYRTTLYVGDFNGDGKTDILCHDGNGQMWIAYANNAGAFTSSDWRARKDFCKCQGCSLCIGDFNMDGKSDLLCQPYWLMAYANSDGNFYNTY